MTGGSLFHPGCKSGVLLRIAQHERIIAPSFSSMATFEYLFKYYYYCNMENKNKAPVCGVTYIDEEKILRVKNNFPEDELIFDSVEILKALSDSTRLKIVLALAKEELCVCDLSALTNVSVSGISHQLRLLRGLRLVKYRKQGKMVYYSLADGHVNSLIATALEHAGELNN